MACKDVPALPRILPTLLQLPPGSGQGRARQHHAAGTPVVAHRQVQPVGLQRVILSDIDICLWGTPLGLDIRDLRTLTLIPYS